MAGGGSRPPEFNPLPSTSRTHSAQPRRQSHKRQVKVVAGKESVHCTRLTYLLLCSGTGRTQGVVLNATESGMHSRHLQQHVSSWMCTAVTLFLRLFLPYSEVMNAAFAMVFMPRHHEWSWRAAAAAIGCAVAQHAYPPPLPPPPPPLRAHITPSRHLPRKTRVFLHNNRPGFASQVQ